MRATITNQRRTAVTIPRRLQIFFKAHGLQLLIALSGALVFYVRRPDALNRAQFRAEDGTIYFQTAFAHHFSLATLALPYAGYVQLYPRLVAMCSGLVGIAHAPLFFNVMALAVEVLPLVYLWSNRFSDFVPSTPLKIYLSVIYLILPYTDEVNLTITNSQWYLAIIAFMLLFMREAEGKVLRYAERILLAVCCLSGPFGIFLLAIAGADRYFYKGKRNPAFTTDKLIIILVATMVELLYLLVAGPHNRIHSSIGFSTGYFWTIMGGQVFGSGLLDWRAGSALMATLWVTITLTLTGIICMCWAFIKGSRILRALILYVSLILAASLLVPNSAHHLTWWHNLSIPYVGGRYYFLFHLTMFVALGAAVCYGTRYLKIFATILLGISLLIGVPTGFRQIPYTDYGYDRFVKQYEAAKPGQIVAVRLNPGSPWSLRLVKR